jgi:hypothetical protein
MDGWTAGEKKRKQDKTHAGNIQAGMAEPPVSVVLVVAHLVLYDTVL